MEVNTITKHLLFSTIRIEASNNSFKNCSVGTGFFYMKKHGESTIPFIVTNKHVIGEYDSENLGGFKQGRMFLTKAKDNKPLLGEKFDININDNFSNRWFYHEDKNVDIAIIPLAPILHEVKKKHNTDLFFRSITEDIIPSKKDLENIDALEEIIFVGYPNGLFDGKNFTPIIRKGITATPIGLDFNGKKIFLIDASVFPGSSGSPVFIYKSGKLGSITTSDRFYFCGIISRTYHKTEEGIIKQAPILTIDQECKLISESKQMIDIGIVFKSSLVRECIDQFLKKNPIKE